MVSDKDFMFHMCIPCGTTFSIMFFKKWQMAVSQIYLVFLLWSKLKAFPEDQLNVVQMMMKTLREQEKIPTMFSTITNTEITFNPFPNDKFWTFPN